MVKFPVHLSILASATVLLLSSMASADPVTLRDTEVAQQNGTIAQPLSVGQETTSSAAEQQVIDASDDGSTMMTCDHGPILAELSVQKIDQAINYQR